MKPKGIRPVPIGLVRPRAVAGVPATCTTVSIKTCIYTSIIYIITNISAQIQISPQIQIHPHRNIMSTTLLQQLYNHSQNTTTPKYNKTLFSPKYKAGTIKYSTHINQKVVLAHIKLVLAIKHSTHLN